jgi:alpha-tubulin suppressor-like RCC1 family protein
MDSKSKEKPRMKTCAVNPVSWLLVSFLVSSSFLLSVRSYADATPPFVQTQAAGPVTDTNAMLNGMVVPNGLPTTAWFEWGTNGNYGQTTAPLDAGDGFVVVRISAGISNLPPQSIFRCRLVASNSVGVVYGGPVLLTTGQRVTEWGDLRNGLSPVPAGLTNAVAISAEYYSSSALTTAGNVVAWGDNTYGEATVPVSASNVVTVACGLYFDLALRQDGQVVAWGRGDTGQTNVPSDLTNAIAISAGFYHSVALKEDRTVEAWGEDSYGYGETNVPAGLSNVVAVAAGGYSSFALKADGTIVAWGSVTSVPSGWSNTVAVCGARWQGLAIQSDGSIAILAGATNLPDGMGYALAVSSGYLHSMALNDNGQVFAWGDDSVGQTNVPSGLSNVVAVAAGGYHCVALANLPPQALAQTTPGLAGQDIVVTLQGTDANNDTLSFQILSLPATGTLYQWTPGGRGDPILSPDTQVEDSAGRVILNQALATNVSFTFLVNDGLEDSAPAQVNLEISSAWTFGRPNYASGNGATTLRGVVVAAVPGFAWFEWGLIGNYDNITPAMPVAGNDSVQPVTALVTGLPARANFQCRLVVSNEFGLAYGSPVWFTSGQHMFGWGSNGNGQLNVPAGISNAVFAACGWYNSFAIRADSTAIGWGWNGSGQATPPAGLTNAVEIAAGYYHGLALKSDGTVVAWGNDSWGQTNVPAGLSNVVDISAGYTHSMALTSGGTVVTWGQFGSAIQTNVPPGLSNVVAIDGGLFADIALKADGTVVSWGTDNGGGETVIPAGLMNVVAIAAGEYHCLALKSDGTVVAWGSNSSGQSTVPSGLSNVVAVAAGGSQSVALKADGTVVAWGSTSISFGDSGIVATNFISFAAGAGHIMALGNLLPHATNQVFVGLVGQDLTLTLSGSDPDNDPLAWRIVSLPAIGTLYQWTPGGRGPAIAIPGTMVTDLQARLIFAPESGLTGWPYTTFTFVVNDGEDDSPLATNTVNMIPAPLINVSSLNFGTNGVFTLTFNGITNATYRVWASTNLATWVLLGSPMQISAGLFKFTNSANSFNPGGVRQFYRTRFYRITSP